MEETKNQSYIRRAMDFIQWFLVASTLLFFTNKTRNPILGLITICVFVLLSAYAQIEINKFLERLLAPISPRGPAWKFLGAWLIVGSVELVLVACIITYGYDAIFAVSGAQN